MADRTRDDGQGRDTEDGSRGPVDGERPALPAGDDQPALAAEVVVSHDRTAECTIYPFDAPDRERVVHWITAAEGSFVALEELR
jgi:hypothetical protein